MKNIEHLLRGLKKAQVFNLNKFSGFGVRKLFHRIYIKKIYNNNTLKFKPKALKKPILPIFSKISPGMAYPLKS